MSSMKATTEQEQLLTINIEDLAGIDGVLPGVTATPLFLDKENGVWVIFAKFAPGTILPTHFHTGIVHFFTTKGEWNYLEHPEDVQRKGSYLYEPGGSVHTFSVAEDAKEAAEGFMVVYGANINFGAEGEFINIMDAGWIENMLVEGAKKNGMATPRYIKPKAGAGFSDD